MSTSQRLKGREGFYLSLKNGTATAYTIGGDDVKGWELTPEDRDDSDLTFWEAAQGQAKDWTLKLTGIVSFDLTSLWSYLWTNPGVEVAVVLGPRGNAVHAPGKPVLTFTANTGGKPPLENEARSSNEGAQFEHELKLSTEPNLSTGA